MPKDDTVERLTGDIARDFDLLLTTIVGHAERLGEYFVPGDPRAIEVAAIRQAAERASRLTLQFLAFSRTRTLRPKVVDVNAVVSRVRYTLERLVGEQIRLELRLAADARRVRIDAEHLQQILINLALSARDAMPDGGVLEISTAHAPIAAAAADAREIEPGNYVALSVTDSGPAIDSTVQPYLFDPPDATASRRRGAGLGLAIVHGVITQSGGRIDVESPVHNNAGSRFVVLVPAVEDDEPQPVEPDGTSRGTETILVAADDPNLQALIVAVLRRRGYGVLDAHDAWQAVRLAGNHDDRIDLLITTTTTNGRVIADAFRGARAESRVLLIGVAAAESPSAGGEEQFAKDAVLAQPFTPDALGRKVRGLLTAARVHLEMRILP